MAGELSHKTVGTQLTQSEFEQIDGHLLDSQATDDTIRAASATSLVRIKNAFSQSVAPGVSDDGTDGWPVGCVWIDTTNDIVYVNVDISTGAAVWNLLSDIATTVAATIDAIQNNTDPLALSGTLQIGDGSEINLQEEIVWTATGPATTAADHSIARDDGDVLHLNVPTGDTMEFSVNDVAVATIGATTLGVASGITFPASQSASANVNTLDDYEENTWTPQLADDSLDGSGESQAYATQIGTYTKIGRSVLFHGRLVMSSLGTLTGGEQARIMGLPFTANNSASQIGGVTIVYAAGLAVSSGVTVTGTINPNTNYINLWGWDGTLGTSLADVNDITADGELVFFGSYIAAT